MSTFSARHFAQRPAATVTRHVQLVGGRTRPAPFTVFRSPITRFSLASTLACRSFACVKADANFACSPCNWALACCNATFFAPTRGALQLGRRFLSEPGHRDDRAFPFIEDP